MRHHNLSIVISSLDDIHQLPIIEFNIPWLLMSKAGCKSPDINILFFNNRRR